MRTIKLMVCALLLGELFSLLAANPAETPSVHESVRVPITVNDEIEAEVETVGSIVGDEVVDGEVVVRYEWDTGGEGEQHVVPIGVRDEETLEAFLRVCIAEADGHLQDCVGIWQVLSTIRRRRCERGEVRRITECDEDGETMLSVMRRGQRHVLGMIPIKNHRAKWIAGLTTDCDVPPAWPSSAELWNARYGAKRCPAVVELGRQLMAGKLPRPVPGHSLSWLPEHPITWGGRCEDRRGACDDTMACARGLVRVRSGPETHNAFWRRPTYPTEIDPVCRRLTSVTHRGTSR